MEKKYIIPIIAFSTFIVGCVTLIVPFLPFGWLLFGLTALLLMPYFNPLKKGFGWVAGKDGTGTMLKMGKKVVLFYQWADDPKKAAQIEKVLDEQS